MLAWKDPHRIRLSQLVRGCTLEYVVWVGRKIKNIVFPQIKIRVSVLDLIPRQPSEVDIVRSKFALEKLKMEQKYLRLQKRAKKSESNA